MKKIFFYVLIFLCATIFSCNRLTNPNVLENTSYIAQIDSINILTTDVDKTIRQELYDELSRIYLIRKVAMEEVIKIKILEIEAKKRKLTIEALKDILYTRKLNDVNLRLFAEKVNNSKSIAELRETLVYHDINSEKGKELLMKRYKEYLLHQFTDSLKKLHDIKILLTPPQPPKITINDLITHYNGNLNSAVTFLVISDFDCSMCREHNDFFKKLYSKYKGKVRFGFTHYSSYVSNSAVASECASNQGKFWEMHDSIFNTKLVPDSVTLFRIARNLNLDMNTFGNDYKDKALSERIMDNLLKLESAGIYGTPTIMINNQLVYNSTSLEEIEKMLNEEIEKVD